jgi:hypothetical protein
MSSTARPKTGRSKTNAPAGASINEIAHRAFEYYAARGGEHGRDLEDWLRAERDLTSAARPAKKRTAGKSRAD